MNPSSASSLYPHVIKVFQSVLVLATAGLLGGCSVQENSKKSVLFPLWAVRQETHFHENGAPRRLEESGSVLLLLNWSKELEWDSDGDVLKRNEDFLLLPIIATKHREDRREIKKSGSILLVLNYHDEIPKHP